ncbi:hypothetical protein RRG08_053953 [Elysia crispata]|uniref:Uncharacterized protein n=1 Tax=Elysia crispata TaxID=231223 RepID=A0AAE0ZEH0_9GAST|nr:hypothetical protein RRG08_053953 [Elysia crispata]
MVRTTRLSSGVRNQFPFQNMALELTFGDQYGQKEEGQLWPMLINEQVRPVETEHRGSPGQQGEAAPPQAALLVGLLGVQTWTGLGQDTPSHVHCIDSECARTTVSPGGREPHKQLFPGTIAADRLTCPSMGFGAVLC